MEPELREAYDQATRLAAEVEAGSWVDWATPPGGNKRESKITGVEEEQVEEERGAEEETEAGAEEEEDDEAAEEVEVVHGRKPVSRRLRGKDKTIERETIEMYTSCRMEYHGMTL